MCAAVASGAGGPNGAWGCGVEAAHVPLRWDPVLGVLGALDVLLLADVQGDTPVPAWSRTVLHDEQGRETGAWTLSGELSREGERLAYRGQLMGCRVRFEVGEQVVSVEPYQLVTMPVRRRVATSAGAIATGRGNGYWGVTTAAWGEGVRTWSG